MRTGLASCRTAGQAIHRRAERAICVCLAFEWGSPNCGCLAEQMWITSLIHERGVAGAKATCLSSAAKGIQGQEGCVQGYLLLLWRAWDPQSAFCRNVSLIPLHVDAMCPWTLPDHHLHPACWVCVSRSVVSNSAWTVAHQAPQSMEFSRQEYWNGLPSSSPGDLPDLGIEPWSPALQAILYRLSYQRSPTFVQAPRQTQETIHSPSKAHREAKPPHQAVVQYLRFLAWESQVERLWKGNSQMLHWVPMPPVSWQPYNKLSCWGLKRWGWGAMSVNWLTYGWFFPILSTSHPGDVTHCSFS